MQTPQSPATSHSSKHGTDNPEARGLALRAAHVVNRRVKIGVLLVVLHDRFMVDLARKVVSLATSIVLFCTRVSQVTLY